MQQRDEADRSASQFSLQPTTGNMKYPQKRQLPEPPSPPLPYWEELLSRNPNEVLSGLDEDADDDERPVKKCHPAIRFPNPPAASGTGHSSAKPAAKKKHQHSFQAKRIHHEHGALQPWSNTVPHQGGVFRRSNTQHPALPGTVQEASRVPAQTFNVETSAKDRQLFIASKPKDVIITAEHFLVMCREHGHKSLLRRKELEAVCLLVIQNGCSQDLRRKVLTAFKEGRAPDARGLGFSSDIGASGAQVYHAGYEMDGSTFVDFLRKEMPTNVHAQCAAMRHEKVLGQRQAGADVKVYPGYTGRLMSNSKTVGDRKLQHISGVGSKTTFFHPAFAELGTDPHWWLVVFPPGKIRLFVSEAQSKLKLTESEAFKNVMDVAEALAGAMLMSQSKNGGFQATGGGNVWGANTCLRMTYVCFAALNNMPNKEVESYVATAVGQRIKLRGETTAEADAVEELDKKALTSREKQRLCATQAMPFVKHDSGLLASSRTTQPPRTNPRNASASAS